MRINKIKTVGHEEKLLNAELKLIINFQNSQFFYFSSFRFELWAEHSRLLANMDLCTALAAFYHLCFAFDLHYPKVNYIIRTWIGTNDNMTGG